MAHLRYGIPIQKGEGDMSALIYRNPAQCSFSGSLSTLICSDLSNPVKMSARLRSHEYLL